MVWCPCICLQTLLTDWLYIYIYIYIYVALTQYMLDPCAPHLVVRSILALSWCLRGSHFGWTRTESTTGLHQCSALWSTPLLLNRDTLHCILFAINYNTCIPVCMRIKRTRYIGHPDNYSQIHIKQYRLFIYNYMQGLHADCIDSHGAPICKVYTGSLLPAALSCTTAHPPDRGRPSCSLAPHPCWSSLGWPTLDQSPLCTEEGSWWTPSDLPPNSACSPVSPCGGQTLSHHYWTWECHHVYNYINECMVYM